MPLKTGLLLIYVFAITLQCPGQQKPVLRQQASLNDVSEVVSSARQNAYLAKSLSGYVLIDQGSKIQLGSLNLDLDQAAVPGWGKIYLWGDSSFIMSTGGSLLKADPISGSVDTLFAGVEFPEFIVNYIPWPGNEDLLLIATKTYPLDSKKSVNFFKDDGKGKIVYDESRNARFILFDTRTKTILRSVISTHVVTVFAESVNNKDILAGTFQGDVIKIDKALSTSILFHAFDLPVHSLQQQQDIIVTVPHIAPKFIGEYGDGDIYFYNNTTKEKKKIRLPKQEPLNDPGTGMTALPSNRVKRIFSLPRDRAILVNFGFRGLLRVSVPTLDSSTYPISFNEANFFCFNRDSTQLLASTSDQVSFFGPGGDLAAYDLARNKFQASFRKSLSKEHFSKLYKIFDKEGNYHFVGLRSELGDDSLVIFSSNKTSPTLIIGNGGDFIINEKDTTIFIETGGKAIYGSLELEKLRQDRYVFSIGHGYNESDTLHPEIFNLKLDTRKLPGKDIPYGITGIHEMNRGQRLIAGYIPQKTTNTQWIRVIDSAGKVKFAVSELKIGILPEFYKLSPSGNILAFYSQKAGLDVLELWNPETNKKLIERIIPKNARLQSFQFDKSKDVLWYAQTTLDKPTAVFKIDLSAPVISASLAFSEYGFFSFQTDIANDLIASESYSSISLHRLSDRKLLWTAIPSTSSFKVANHPGGFAFASEQELFVVNNNSDHLYFAAFDGLKPVEIFNDYLYKGDKTAINNLAFVLNRKGYMPGDYDMYFNRPDSVLIRAGSTNKAYNQLIANTVEKRKRYYPAKNLELLLEKSPFLSVVNKSNIPDVISTPGLKVKVKGRSVSGKPITAVHVSDNGVPVFGSKGFLIPSAQPEFEVDIDIPLVKDRNSLQLYAEDVDGLVSSVENISVVGDFAAPVPKTYFIGIGVSNYQQTSMNLHYADKDIRDLSAEFSKKFPGCSIDTFINSDATAANILAIKNKLKQTNIEDRVVISLSGHGLVDTSSNFYFATYDIDFANPSGKGLQYNEIESLLEDIPARKKLLLIDACHSGEIDRDIQVDSMETDDSPGLKEFGPKGLIIKTGEKSVGLQNSFELMRELFADVSKNNGTVVISAAGGLEYALEDAKYNNGVFTYAVKKGILEYAADKNGDNEITVNELKEYVSKAVEEYTKGKQKPTTRKEVLEFDWTLW